jgi:hypothetical protein
MIIILLILLIIGIVFISLSVNSYCKNNINGGTTKNKNRQKKKKRKKKKRKKKKRKKKKKNSKSSIIYNDLNIKNSKSSIVYNDLNIKIEKIENILEDANNCLSVIKDDIENVKDDIENIKTNNIKILSLINKENIEKYINIIGLLTVFISSSIYYGIYYVCQEDFLKYAKKAKWVLGRIDYEIIKNYKKISIWDIISIINIIVKHVRNVSSGYSVIHSITSIFY